MGFILLIRDDIAPRRLMRYPAPHGKREINEMLKKIQRGITEQVDAWRAEDSGPSMRGSRVSRRPRAAASPRMDKTEQ